MKYISKKKIRNNVKKTRITKKKNIHTYGGKPPVAAEYRILRTVNDIPLEQRLETCGICIEPLCMPNENDKNINDAGNIVQLHPSIEPQAPHLFHYDCLSGYFKFLKNNGICPTCRFDISEDAVTDLLNEEGLERDDIANTPLEWAAYHWRRYQMRGPRLIRDIANYIPPPVDDRMQLPNIPEGCSFRPRGRRNRRDLTWNGPRRNICSRTNAANNNPNECAVSDYNRCIQKKKSDRPVGCKFVNNQQGVPRCVPTLLGEANDTRECLITATNKCNITTPHTKPPLGCVAIPFVNINGFGTKKTFKCKPTNNPDHNQPEYCTIDALNRCQKKKSYKSHRRNNVNNDDI
jgi:hypothetical protein